MKIVVIEPLGIAKEKFIAYSEEILKDLDYEMTYYSERATSNGELIERGKEADVIIIANQQIDVEVVEGWKNLKLLSVAFTGLDHIPTKMCEERGIKVYNSAGYSDAAVADLVFCMVINLLRNIKECDAQVRNEGTKDGLIGNELEGKKFGIIGTGKIGMRVANIASAFGCNVLAYNRTKKEDTENIKYVDLETLLKESDIVSIHVPLTEQTKNLINKENLKLMKKSSIIINTARGGIVNSEDLAEALNREIIAGAGVDVFEVEPPIGREHPLLHAKNVIVTPHIGFATKEALEKRAKIALNNIKRLN